MTCETGDRRWGRLSNILRLSREPWGKEGTVTEHERADPEAAIQRAVAADRNLWSGAGYSLIHRADRDAAIRDALSEGANPARVAEALGVLVADVERMADAPLLS